MSSLKTVAVLFLLGNFICKAYSSVQFYPNENFKGDEDSDESPYVSVNIPAPSSCETFPWILLVVASVKTTACINLFSEEDCEGTQYRLEEGDHPTLGYFKHEAASYRACDELSYKYPSTEYRAKFYRLSHFEVLELDGLISKECTSTPQHVFSVISSLKTPKCIILYPTNDCAGLGSYIAQGDVPELPAFINRKVNSFIQCDSKIFITETATTIQPARQVGDF